MKKVDMKVSKNRLLSERARLRQDVQGMVESALSAGTAQSRMPIHMADLSADMYVQEFTLSLMPNEEQVLQAIETALERIEEGTYGACEQCGQAIAKARLNAIPYTSLCIRCAEKFEHR